MEIDIYQQCPCHTEKKIKFCCGKSVVVDLDSIMSKHTAGQTSSALDQLDRAIEKSGPKDCLVTIQTKLLLEAGELEKADASNELFMRSNPNHQTGHLHRAMIAVARGDLSQAIEALQDTMDSITGNSLPVNLAQPFRMVGVLLMQRMRVFAGREHLRFAESLKPDPEVRNLFERSIRGSASLIQKTDLQLGDPEPGAEWEKKFTNVLRALRRGQFRKGLALLMKADATFPNVYAIERGIAVLNIYLDRHKDAVSALEKIVSNDSLEQWKRVEAQCLINNLSEHDETLLDVVRHTFEVNDFERLKEITDSDKRLHPMPVVAFDHDPFNEGPVPRAGYFVLDKEIIEQDAEGLEDISLSDVPMVQGEVLLYGKQTDRPARLEYVKPQDSQYETMLATLKEIFADVIQGEPKEQKIDSVFQLDHESNFDWRLPETLAPETHQRLAHEKFRENLLEKVPSLKTNMLGGLTPAEAAGKPELEIQQQAYLLFLRQMNNGERFPSEVVDEFAEKLKIPPITPVVLKEREIETMSPALQASLDIEKISDADLLRLHHYSFSIANYPVIAITNPELLNRPSTHSTVSKRVLLATQARIEPDVEKGLELLAQVRVEAKSAGEPLGMVLVEEFEYRLSRGLTGKKLKDLVHVIQTRHLEEPGVEPRMMAVLERFGLIDPQAMAGNPMDSTMQSPLDNIPATAWQTPDTASASAGSESGGEESKLWIPE